MGHTNLPHPKVEAGAQLAGIAVVILAVTAWALAFRAEAGPALFDE